MVESTGDPVVQTTVASPLPDDVQNALNDFNNAGVDTVNRFNTELLSSVSVARDRITEIRNRLSAHLTNVDSGTVYLNLEKTLEALHDWSENLVPQLQEEPVWWGLEAHEKQCLESLAAEVFLQIHEEDVQTSADDGFVTRSWKRGKRIQFSIGNALNRISDSARSLIRQTKTEREPRTRRVDVHNVMRRYCVQPTARSVFSAWQQAMQNTAKEMFEVRESLGQILHPLVSADSFRLLAQTDEKSKALERIREFSIRLGTIDPQNRSIPADKPLFVAASKDLEDAWARAGTALLPKRKISAQGTQRVWQEMELEYEKSRLAWESHFKAEKRDWESTIDLLLLQVRVTRVFFETATTIQKRANEFVLPLMKQVHALMKSSLASFEEDMKDSKDIPGRIQAEKRTLVRELRRELIPKIMDAIDDSRLDKTIENYLSRIGHNVQQLPDEHVIFQSRDLDHENPQSAIVRIDLKEIVRSELLAELSRTHSEYIEQAREQIDELLRTTSEFDQLVDVNLDAGLELLARDDLDTTVVEAKTAVIEGLTRASDQIDMLTSRMEEFVGDGQKRLFDLTLVFAEKLDELASNDRVIDLQLRRARAKAEADIRGVRGRVHRWIMSAVPGVVAVWKRGTAPIVSGYRRVRKLTGFAPVMIEGRSRISDFIEETEKQVARLPYVYQRLFSITPLSEERSMVTRSSDFDVLKSRYEIWLDGYHGATAVVGEKGSGRTTLVNLAQQRMYSKIPCRRIDCVELKVLTVEELFSLLKTVFQMEAATSIDDIERDINEKKERIVVIADDIQNMFLRTIDGLDVIRRFLLFVSRTDERVHWVVTCSRYSWNYFDRVMDVSHHFGAVVDLGNFEKNDIQEIILKRHRMSGYRMEFDVPESVSRSRGYKALESDEARQNFIVDKYFERLNHLAAGNVSVALLLWLSGIRKFEGGALTISPELDLDDSIIHQLPVRDLFTFAALLQHERLSAEEHSLVFNQAIEDSVVDLERMCHRGFLLVGPGGRYRINHVIYRLVVRALKTRNIIY